ncbi:MAG: 2-C-methyl-D-erythritol 4-phosphate cytidylyltransferase [Victivallaceae bacterium]
MKNDISLIFLAGGIGSRFGTSTPKQFLPLNGIPVAFHSLKTFLLRDDLSEIIVVCSGKYRSIFKDFPVRFASPGNQRIDSVASGLKKLSTASKYVCIHDAVRPFINNNDISELFVKGRQTGAAALAEPIINTVKEIDPDQSLIVKTVNRDLLVKTHTPQFLEASVLKKGLLKAQKQNLILTDDVSCAELLGTPCTYVFTKDLNIKITSPKDLAIAQALIQL